MKKITIPILFAIAVLGGLAVLTVHPGQKHASDSAVATPTETTTPATTPSPTATPTTAASYKDGSFTGQAVDNRYGTVQVKAVIANGKITDVKFLQMPSGGHSGEVTDMASSQLRSETLTAQSAHVDLVSGATQTSESYIQSIQSALDQAKA